MSAADLAALITASASGIASIIAALAALSTRSQVQTPGTKTIAQLVEDVHTVTTNGEPKA